MRMRNWQHLAVATIVAFGLAACEGGADEPEPATGEAAEIQQPPAGQTGGQAQQGTGEVPPGATQEQVAQGRQVFTGAGNCFTCHGQQAKGTQLAPDLTDDTWINLSANPTMEAVMQLVREGVAQPVEHPSPMPPMGGGSLSDEQVRAVSAYVLSL